MIRMASRRFTVLEDRDIVVQSVNGSKAEEESWLNQDSSAYLFPERSNRLLMNIRLINNLNLGMLVNG